MPETSIWSPKKKIWDYAGCGGWLQAMAIANRWVPGLSMDWFEGKSTGNHGFCPSKAGVSCRCSLIIIIYIYIYNLYHINRFWESLKASTNHLNYIWTDQELRPRGPHPPCRSWMPPPSASLWHSDALGQYCRPLKKKKNDIWPLATGGFGNMGKQWSKTKKSGFSNLGTHNFSANPWRRFPISDHLSDGVFNSKFHQISASL